jgi:hypothetical protein
MPQYFPRTANTFARMTIFAVVLALAVLLWLSYLVVRSPYEMMQNVPREQPVPFSHEHHVGGLGIDCRYCHTTVETSSFANIPATKICMNCHSQMWATSPMLEPVRESYRTGKSIEWTRVNDLPDFVFFNHSVHVQHGIGCDTCHGRVDKMPLMWQAQDLTMAWCLNCHRRPEEYVRPKDQVFNMGYAYPPNQLQVGRKLVAEYHIQRLTSCSICHR